MDVLLASWFMAAGDEATGSAWNVRSTNFLWRSGLLSQDDVRVRLLRQASLRTSCPCSGRKLMPR